LRTEVGSALQKGQVQLQARTARHEALQIAVADLEAGVVLLHLLLPRRPGLAGQKQGGDRDRNDYPQRWQPVRGG